MKPTMTILSKSACIAGLVILVLQLQTGNAQTVLFQEDFETSPVTSILNNWGGETQLPEGPSPCSKGSRGNTADFNSVSVDFLNSQNPGYFLGVNPQSPCGGYYYATLITDSLDFSAADSLVFKCRYFVSNSIGWGPSGITITLGNPSDDFVIETEFSTLNTWDTVEVTIPASIIGNKVQISIMMGGGEAAGIDNIQVIGYTYAAIGKNYNADHEIKIYPVPSGRFIHLESGKIQSGTVIVLSDMQGKIVHREICRSANKVTIDTEPLPKGIYILQLTDDAGNSVRQKIVKN